MNRFAYSVFCDDVRQEMNGKMSFMGVYHGGLLVNEIPCTLPKLCVVIYAVTPIDRPFDSLIYRGHLDDEQIFEIQMSSESLAESRDENRIAAAPEGKKLITQAMAIISPAVIDKAASFKITVDADGEEIYCPGLYIGLAPDTAQVTLG